jgi:hypothetical protein
MSEVVTLLWRRRHHRLLSEEGPMIRNLRSSPPSSNEKDGAPHRDNLLQLATWYRAQAERAGSPWVWEARLQRAEDLEVQAREWSKISSGRADDGPEFGLMVQTGAADKG